MWLSRDIFVGIPAGVSYSPSTSNSRTCCGNRTTIVGPSARTSMNLNRAILPCPLDFPVAIANARRNNIHLTICRASTCAYAPLIRFVRPGTDLFHFAPPSTLPVPPPDWYSPNPREFRHSENSHFCRSSCTHSRLINFPRWRDHSKFVGIQRESVQFAAIRDRAKCPRHALLKNDSIFVFCFLFLFPPFFFNRNAIWSGGFILIGPRRFSRTVAAIGPRSTIRYLRT